MSDKDTGFKVNNGNYNPNTDLVDIFETKKSTYSYGTLGSDNQNVLIGDAWFGLTTWNGTDSNDSGVQLKTTQSSDYIQIISSNSSRGTIQGFKINGNGIYRMTLTLLFGAYNNSARELNQLLLLIVEVSIYFQ